MQKLVLFFLMGILVSCNTKVKTGNKNSLADAFIRSVKENKFELLENFLADKEVYKLVAAGRTQGDSFVDSFLLKYKNRTRSNWETIVKTSKEKKIDFSKLTVKEWLVYSPFKGENKAINAGVLVYDYDGKTWDDLSFMITEINAKTYLLEMPNPTRAFSFADTALRNSSEAKLYLQLADSSFKIKVQERVKELISLAKENRIEQVAENAVYSGDDESRRWQSAMNPSDVKEFEQAGLLVKRINSALESCGGDYSFDNMDYGRESEGVWMVQKVICGSRIIYFAFLKIGEKLLLGEINAEEKTAN